MTFQYIYWICKDQLKIAGIHHFFFCWEHLRSFWLVILIPRKLMSTIATHHAVATNSYLFLLSSGPCAHRPGSLPSLPSKALVILLSPPTAGWLQWRSLTGRRGRTLGGHRGSAVKDVACLFRVAYQLGTETSFWFSCLVGSKRWKWAEVEKRDQYRTMGFSLLGCPLGTKGPEMGGFSGLLLSGIS